MPEGMNPHTNTMKNILVVLLSVLTITLNASTNVVEAVSTDAEWPATSDWSDSIKRIVALNPDAQHATNWTVAIAPSYAKGLQDVDGNLKEWGATAALLYPLGPYVYAGARVDYIAGDFFMPSLGVELKADIRLFNRIDVTPFAVTGVSYSVSGDADTEGEVGAIYGAGLKLHLFTVKSVRVGGFAEWERWTQFPDVDIFHAGVTASFSF